MRSFYVCIRTIKKKFFFGFFVGTEKEWEKTRFDSMVEAEAWKTYLIMVERVQPRNIKIIEG